LKSWKGEPKRLKVKGMWNYPIWSAGFAWIPRKKLKGKVGKKKKRRIMFVDEGRHILSITNHSRNEEKHWCMKPMNNWFIILIQDEKSITFPHTTRPHILIMLYVYQLQSDISEIKKKEVTSELLFGTFLSCQNLDL